MRGLAPKTHPCSVDRTQWRPARQPSLVPVQALAKLFRGICRALVRQERPALTLPASVGTMVWGAYSQPAAHGTVPGLRSLGQ
jgi:hypothetical protein